MSGAQTAYDALVIGGGHNGLICAATLARAGRRVVLVEAADRLGGAAITREFAPGFRVSAGAHVLHMLPRAIVDELGLAAHGLAPATSAIPTTSLLQGAAPVGIAADGVSGVSAADSAAWQKFDARMRRFAAHLRPLLQAAPPRLGTRAWQDQLGLLRMAWHVRRLGRTEMRELLRIIGMNIYDLAEENFTNPALRGAVALDAVLGANAGPRAPGTVLNYLYRLAGESGAMPMALPAGGMGAVADALAKAAKAAGVTLRTGARVARILVQDDRACGVQLENGETISAKLVISNADPKTTFLRLLGAAHLDTGFVRYVSHFRDRGLTAKLHLALRDKPHFTGLSDAALAGRMLIAPGLDYVENAFNPSKYGACSEAPALEITLPSLTDASLAPAGQHVLSAVVQYAPYAPKAGWAAERAPFIARIMAVLEAHAPGLSALVTASELLTPADIEAEFGISGGHWHHGELAFDQFFMVRPVPGAAQYATPMPGLFLCGAGCHPGGGVMGLAGRNAARHILSQAG